MTLLINEVTKYNQPAVCDEETAEIQSQTSSTWSNFLDNNITPQTLDAEVTKEIMDYLRSVPTPNIKLRDYWKCSPFKYLQKFARVIHAIPASNSTAERTFHKLGRVDTNTRPNLSGEQVTNLVKLNCLQKYFTKQNSEKK